MPGRIRKVLFIVTAYPRHDGDVITPWLGETIARLRDVDVEAAVLAPAFGGGGDQTVGGVRVHRFRYAPARWETLSHDHPISWQLTERPLRFALVPGYVAACTVAATRLARGGAFDVLHAFWPLPHALPGMVARRLTGTPLVSTFFGAELHWLARHPLARALVRAIVRESDAVTAISEYTARELQLIAPLARPAIIPFGGAFSPAASTSARAVFVTEPARFLFVGRLIGRKGLDVLLQAMTQLDARATLTIVGDGAERDRLRARVTALHLADRVTFTGHIPQDALERELDACDALILPAITDAVAGTEGLGVVLIEAMSHGKPVIASDAGGIPDIVRHERTGLLVPQGDPTALAEAMRRLMGDPALAQRLGADGKAHVESGFGWPRIVETLAALYESVSARRST